MESEDSAETGVTYQTGTTLNSKMMNTIEAMETDSRTVDKTGEPGNESKVEGDGGKEEKTDTAVVQETKPELKDEVLEEVKTEEPENKKEKKKKTRKKGKKKGKKRRKAKGKDRED